MLTDDQLAAIDRDGYATIDSPFTPAEIDAAVRAMDLACGNDTDNYFGGDIYDQALLSLILHPFMEETAKRMLRTPRVGMRAVVMRRSMPHPDMPTGSAPRLESEHVDIHFPLSDWDASPRRTLCTALIWLSDVTPTRAPYMWRPGSLRQLAAIHDGPARIDNFTFDKLPDLPYADPVPLVARAGQVSVGNNGVIHSGSSNTDTQPRRVLFTQWQSRDVPEVDFGQRNVAQMNTWFDKLRPMLTPAQLGLMWQV